mmetsp:Transcript_17692/g.25476  ORF Transcript_17692/g.25476 Transcript_17692/m.25476 type:complete len:122 (+) Transcript_17692:2008-2373(+)
MLQTPYDATISNATKTLAAIAFASQSRQGGFNGRLQKRLASSRQVNSSSRQRSPDIITRSTHSLGCLQVECLKPKLTQLSGNIIGIEQNLSSWIFSIETLALNKATEKHFEYIAHAFQAPF